MDKAKNTIESNDLLVNPDVETQVKDKPIKKVPRVIFITLLSLFIFVGYIFGFSASGYPKINNKLYIGILNTSNFYEVNFGDLCVVKNIDSLSSVKKGDVVFYIINGESYSARVESVETEIIVIQNKEGFTSVAQKNLQGVLVSRVAVLGFFVGLVCSYYGAIIFSLILFAYLCYTTISRINYENTEKGKRLRDKYLKENKAQKRTKSQDLILNKNEAKELLNFVEIDAITTLNNIKSLTKNKKQFETYELIVDNAHKKYLSLKRWSKDEKLKITIIVELCVCFGRIDLDVEYKIVDLLLKSKLAEFNTCQFLENTKKLMAKGTEETLFNFASILYVLISKNPTLKNKEMKQIVNLFEKELQTRSYDKDSRCVMTLSKIKNLFQI